MAFNFRVKMCQQILGLCNLYCTWLSCAPGQWPGARAVDKREQPPAIGRAHGPWISSSVPPATGPVHEPWISRSVAPATVRAHGPWISGSVLPAIARVHGPWISWSVPPASAVDKQARAIGLAHGLVRLLSCSMLMMNSQHSCVTVSL